MRLFSVIRKIFFSRITVGIIGMAVQLIYLVLLFWSLGTMFTYSYIFFQIVGIITALYLINLEINPSYKLVWVIIILALPIFGCMLYFFYGHKRKGKSMYHHRSSADDNGCYDELLTLNAAAAKQAYYLCRCSGLSIYKDTYTHYYPNGESAFPDILEILRSAECYIFLEYFIIQEGVLWNSILDILLEKVSMGVDIRLVYDELGCIMTLPSSFQQNMEDNGIKCRSFGRIKPFWSGRMNNRDHRKMLIVDGNACFTGGINLADEYINQYEKHGYWKDSVLLLKGKAVESFTVMFLDMWEKLTGESYNIQKYMSECKIDDDGFVLPFSGSPDDNEMTGENAYLNMINGAERYIYITTPYLILDNEMISALTLAAKNGTDVRIMTPHIADKKLIHAVTRANYQRLMAHGVRIYEFLPGFVHAKNFISDDKTAIAGTINLDFRSLYLHYECAVWMYQTSAVEEMRQDFINTLEICTEISSDFFANNGLLKRFLLALIRFFSPMM